MKKYVLIFFIIFSCKEPTYYGENITSQDIVSYTIAKTITLKEGSIETKLQGRILETCSKKGCWMKMETDHDTLLVRFKDYGFFVPTHGVERKKVVVQGNLFVDTLSVDLLRHYAQDAGKSNLEIQRIKEPKLGFSFTANGVIIDE